MDQTGTGMHLDLLQGHGALFFGGTVVVGHGRRGLDRHERQIVQRDACALAQFHGLGHRLGEARLVDHALGRYTVGVLGHPLGVLGQGHALVRMRFGRHGAVLQRIDETVKLRDQRLAAVAEQIADDRRAEA